MLTAHSNFMQHHFHQCSSSGLTPHPVLYCQHSSFSNYSIKAQPVSGRLHRMMSMIAAGKGQRYEWSAGRNVQFTAVWDFHLSSAQWRRAGEREKGSRKGEEWSFFLPPVLPHELNTNWNAAWRRECDGTGWVCALPTLLSEPGMFPRRSFIAAV